MDSAMHHMQIPKWNIQEHSYNMNLFFTVQRIYCWITDVKRKFRHWGWGLDYQLPKPACATMFLPSQWMYDMHLACVKSYCVKANNLCQSKDWWIAKCCAILIWWEVGDEFWCLKYALTVLRQSNTEDGRIRNENRNVFRYSKIIGVLL